MSIIVEKEFDRNLRPRESKGFPRIALRQRSADHPMILFVLVIATTFLAMAVIPPSGMVLASVGASPAISAPALEIGKNNTGLSEADIACRGQAWGAQGVECLAQIARESGHARGSAIRVIAGS